MFRLCSSSFLSCPSQSSCFKAFYVFSSPFSAIQTLSFYKPGLRNLETQCGWLAADLPRLGSSHLVPAGSPRDCICIHTLSSHFLSALIGQISPCSFAQFLWPKWKNLHWAWEIRCFYDKNCCPPLSICCAPNILWKLSLQSSLKLYNVNRILTIKKKKKWSSWKSLSLPKEEHAGLEIQAQAKSSKPVGLLLPLY